MKRGLLVSYASLLLLLPCVATSCDRVARSDPAPILLFAGNGTSTSDVAAVARILHERRLQYATATSSQLNRMSMAQLEAYHLVIIPGGNFMDMSASLTAETAAHIRDAVGHGLNYLGICAGAFLAGDGRGYYTSLDLTSGVRFGFYAAENEGTRKAAVVLTGADGPPIEQYWEDGPELSGWGLVVAKYPDGTPAVVEGTFGQGRVILVGVHPEAPETWRRGMRFTTPARDANAYAGTLVEAALSRTWLPHY